MKRILISRTDNLGDVVLTLPMCGVIKQTYPDSYLFFLGKAYTRPLIDLCSHIDGFLDWDEISTRKLFSEQVRLISELQIDLVIHVFPVKEICRLTKRAGIPIRIATLGRSFTWFYCNRLLYLPRKCSMTHEALLNIRMLKGIGLNSHISEHDIPDFYGLDPSRLFPDPSFPSQENKAIRARRGSERFSLILHPKSKGSAREWGLENFGTLIEMLPVERFSILITGTREEGLQMAHFLKRYQHRVTDLTGKLSLQEFIAVIARSDGLVAASTGPLHIAAALGKKVIGIYAPMRPIFPQRWAPLGKNAHYLVLDKKCSKCRTSSDCECIRSITPESVFRLLNAS